MNPKTNNTPQILETIQQLKQKNNNIQETKWKLQNIQMFRSWIQTLNNNKN